MIESSTRKIAIRHGMLVGELAINVWSAGEPSPVVFCLPGFMGSIGNEYFFLAQHLAKCGYTVVVPDYFGRGDSTYFGRKEAYHSKNTLVSLDAVFSAFPARPRFVIGTSWGGVMAILYTEVYRKKFDGMIFVDIPVINNQNVNPEYRKLLAEICRAQFDDRDSAIAWGYAVLDRTVGPLPAEIDAEFIDRKYIRKFGDRYGYKIDPVMAEIITQDTNNAFNLTTTLPAMKCPVAMLYGKDSWFKDPHIIGQLKKNPESDITIFDNLEGKHPPQLATRDQFLIVQGFLDYASKRASNR